MLASNPTARERGFTLVELIVVLVIIAAVSGLVIPSVAALGRSTDMAASAKTQQDLASNLQQFFVLQKRFPQGMDSLLIDATPSGSTTTPDTPGSNDGTPNGLYTPKFDAQGNQISGMTTSNPALVNSLVMGSLTSNQRQSFGRIAPAVEHRQNKLVVRTSDLAALEQIRGLVRELDVPTALVLLEVRVLSIDNTDGFESFFEYQWADGTTAGQMTTGTIAPPAPGALGPGGTGLRTGDLVFQYVDSRFGARMQLLEREGRVRSLATPVLLTANNVVSRLFGGQEVPITRSFIGGATNQNESTTVTSSGTTGIEFRPVGTTLLMTPSINADRTVSLQIVQETSNANATADVLVPQGDGFVTQSVNVISSQSVSGTIVAKSDLAVAFGGLIETGKSDSTEKVPLLGDIPILGYLFRRDIKESFRREIVVIVEPYVIGTPSEQVDRSVQVLRTLGVDFERLEQPLPDGNERAPTDKVFHDPRRPGFRVHAIDAPKAAQAPNDGAPPQEAPKDAPR